MRAISIDVPKGVCDYVCPSLPDPNGAPHVTHVEALQCFTGVLSQVQRTADKVGDAEAELNTQGKARNKLR